MKAFPHGETITANRRQAAVDSNGREMRDDYGEIVWETVTREIRGCAIYPAGSMGQAFAFENVGGVTSLSSIRYVVYMPSDAQLDSNDKVIYRGLEYDVEGDPGYSHSPFTGREGPITVYLKRVTG